MPDIQAKEVQKLRRRTGAGIMDCKQALQASGGSFSQALDWLKKKGLSSAEKKAGRQAGEGLVASYIHGAGRAGVLVEVNSETDFVARNERFKSFVKALCLHITAMRPLYIQEKDIPESEREKEKTLFKERAMAKNASSAGRMAEGLYKKWLSEVCLLSQEFVREGGEAKQTVQQALNDLIAQTGENIVIRRFSRFALGERAPDRAKNF